MTLQSQEVSTFKVIVVGAQSVGKSSILHQFSTSQFKTQYQITIGLEFVSKQVQIDKHTTMGLQIWDTAGQETFKAIVRSFYRGAAAVFLVYSVASRQSLEALEDYLSEVRNNSHQNVVSVLVGNKTDLHDARKITYEDGVCFSDDNKIDLFFETSAKSGDNVQRAFEEMAKLIFLRFLSDESYKNSIYRSIKSTPQTSQQSSKNQTPRDHRRLQSQQQQVEVIDEDDSEADRTSRHDNNQSIRLSKRNNESLVKKKKCCS